MAQTMGVRAGWRTPIVGAPAATVAVMGLPDLDLVDDLPPESTCLSLDPTWSGLRFTHPRPGRVHANSFGTLPGRRG